MRNKNKKTTLEEYYRIKVDIECVILFHLNSKQPQSITSFTKPKNSQRLTLTSKS